MGSVERSFTVTMALVVLLLAACTPEVDPDDPPLARAWDKYLYWSDLRQVVPMESTPEDSVAIAQRFIGNWMREQAVLRAAELNLAASAKDFEARLRTYHNSLLTFAYEDALVRQKLDTAVSQQEIEEYYEKNRANFELKDNILRLRWFKVREDDRRTLRRLEEHFRSGSPERMHEVEIWLAERGVPIIDRSNTWTTLEALRVEMPVISEIQVDVPDGGLRTVLKDETVHWFVEILEQRTRDSASPLNMVRQDIRSIIINQRKLQLIERMREDLHREAILHKDIELL